MEVVAKKDGLYLIKKYDNYYIRFIGGGMEEIPCDLQITNEEARNIIQDNDMISVIRDEYKKTIPWTMNYFVQHGIVDYMNYAAKMSDVRINKNIAKFDRHEDIKMELYETIMYEQFPVGGAIEVLGYSAEELKENTSLSTLGAYNYLIYLREAPEEALDNLRKGLPLK